MIEPIVIKVTDKVPELVSGPEYVVCDNSDYTVVWQLDEEWAQLEHRTMQVNYKDGTYERVLFTGSSCTLPAIPVSGPVHVGLFAGDIHTTRPARLLAVRSATTDSGEERDPMPNGYAQAIEALDAKLDKSQGAENAGKALVVDAEGNVVPGEAGGSDLSLGITSAAVGQLVKITEVDTDGKPTAWKAVDDRLPKVSGSDDGHVLAVERIGEFDYGYGLKPMPTLGGFIPLGITDASPGQFARVKYVDDYGNPTAWEAADMQGGGEEWELINEITIAGGAEESNALTIDKDLNGQPFSLKHAILYAHFPDYIGESTIRDYGFAMLNGKVSGNVTGIPLAYTSLWPKLSTTLAKGCAWNVTVDGALRREIVISGENLGKLNGVGERIWNTYNPVTTKTQTYYATPNNVESIISIGGTSMLIYPGCYFKLIGVRV